MGRSKLRKLHKSGKTWPWIVMTTSWNLHLVAFWTSFSSQLRSRFVSIQKQMFSKIGALKNLANCTEKGLCLCLRACNFTKKRLQQRCFLVKFAKFLRTLFLQNTSSGSSWVLGALTDWRSKLSSYKNQSIDPQCYELVTLEWIFCRNSYLKNCCGCH